MLTPQEIADRRKARRLLEQKRSALEEAVERKVCEGIYKRIWRHRSTLDEVRDEKLRSRTAALALVGIGLPDLGVVLDTAASSGESEKSLDASVEGYISRARNDLLAMNDAQYPLGKLQHLAAAHKSIVDLLTSLHQSSSSADEILPTLIYTLITTPPEGINVISNLHFTQRFRNATKIDGEAAYCLTNLEAAISFLETVDLASLRSDESLEGPPKSNSSTQISSQTVTEEDSSIPLSRTISSPTTTSIATDTSPSQAAAHPLRSPPQSPTPEKSTSLDRPPSHKRRVSELFQPPTTTLNTAITTADQGLKTVGLTLDNSLKFLFGRLKEQQVASPTGHASTTVMVPRTLDDARRLVEPKPVDEEDTTVSGTSSIAEHQMDGPISSNVKTSASEEKLLGFFPGRPQPRDRSADSAISSGSSSKRVAFAPPSSGGQTSNSRDKASESPQAVNSPIESMRNFGNSINPLKGFTGMNVMRGFGRSASSGTQAPTLTTVAGGDRAKTREEEMQPGSSAAQINGTVESSTQPAMPRTKIEPPISRFLEVANVGDLKVAELEALLTDYKRLAGVLKEVVPF